jgi:hypothetical protein
MRFAYKELQSTVRETSTPFAAPPVHHLLRPKATAESLRKQPGDRVLGVLKGDRRALRRGCETISSISSSRRLLGMPFEIPPCLPAGATNVCHTAPTFPIPAANSELLPWHSEDLILALTHHRAQLLTTESCLELGQRYQINYHFTANFSPTN